MSELFSKLRLRRYTNIESALAERFPIHVVTTWIGNTALIAAKHYLQVTDDHFAKATVRDADSDARPTQNPA